MSNKTQPGIPTTVASPQTRPATSDSGLVRYRLTVRQFEKIIEGREWGRIKVSEVLA
jgi:hypothetical protein